MVDFLQTFGLFLGTVAHTPQKAHKIHGAICLAHSCIISVHLDLVRNQLFRPNKVSASWL